MLKVQVSSLLFAFLASISLATSAADAPPAKTPTVEVAQVVDAGMQVSKVNLNTADAETLERELLGVGKVKAASIVDHRVRISVNVTAHFANNVTGGFTRLRGV